MATETEFERELEIFRTDEENAQQYFFSYLSVRSLAAKDTGVLGVMNTTPLFWITAHHAMLLAAFVALGRIFDQNSEHNLDHLLNVASSDLSIFSKDALRLRKETVVTKQQAAAFVEDAHELTSADIRILRSQIAVRRATYETRYRDIRDKVFAHNALPDVEQVHDLLVKTNVDEMKDIFGFLHALYVALDGLLLNGHKPDVKPYKFRLPPDGSSPGRMAPGERVYREGHAMLKQMLPTI
jgi:hypothetical protein